MHNNHADVVVIIPAYNEENAVGKVLQDIPAGLVREVIVVNNNSNDNTKKIAAAYGATVIDELKQGYGHACLAGMAYVAAMPVRPDIIVFLDADYSDHPEEMPQLLAPILSGQYDFVIGSRALGNREQGSMAQQQVFGNWLATFMMKRMYGIHFTDLGPFRAIRYDALLQLGMQDQTYGWTVEMQLKASKHKLRITEVPVAYRKRVGFSKISGTLKGTVLAGYKIITTILKYK